MAKKKVVSPGYFNANMTRKNSIIENAEFQENDMTQNLKKMETLTKEIKSNVDEKGAKDNVIIFEKVGSIPIDLGPANFSLNPKKKK